MVMCGYSGSCQEFMEIEDEPRHVRPCGVFGIIALLLVLAEQGCRLARVFREMGFPISEVGGEDIGFAR
jgi:hypothetical protein